MKFSLKCRTKIVYESPFREIFAHFLIWKGLIFGPKSGLGKSLTLLIRTNKHILSYKGTHAVRQPLQKCNDIINVDESCG